MIKIISIGHKEPDWINIAIENYIKKINFYNKISIKRIAAVSEKLDKNKQQKLESELLEKNIDVGAFKIALSENGTQFDSISFAKKVDSWQGLAKPINIVIGPTNGLTKEFISKCNASISLSKFTFTHDFAKVIILEQIYRAFAINNNHPYHRQ